MSNDPIELPRPLSPLTWREQLAGVVDDLGLSPTRLVAGLVGIAVIGALAWQLLAPAEPPAEMRLPFAEPAASADVPSTVAGVTDPAGVAAADTPAGAAPASPEVVVVHVAGAVAEPGVQHLDGDARVVDAIDAAGGAGAGADLARLNLAAPLTDGQQVYVLQVGEEPPVLPATGLGPPSSGGSALDPAPAPVDINTATAEQLDTLPGVGPATAAAIISHREQNGPFTTPEQLIEVRGIGDAKMSQLRDLVTVSG